MITVGYFNKHGRPIRVANGCLEWQGSRDAKGYGRLSGGRLAHRAAWELARGPIPKGDGFHGTCVCHSCDNPSCVDVDHLFLGTQLDNMRDKALKGRWHAKLDSHKLAELRREVVHCARRWGWQVGLAKKYGVTKQYVSQLAKHADDPLTMSHA